MLAARDTVMQLVENVSASTHKGALVRQQTSATMQSSAIPKAAKQHCKVAAISASSVAQECRQRCCSWAASTAVDTFSDLNCAYNKTGHTPTWSYCMKQPKRNPVAYHENIVKDCDVQIQVHDVRHTIVNHILMQHQVPVDAQHLLLILVDTGVLVDCLEFV